MWTKVLSLFGYISQSIIPGLYVKSMLNFIFKTAKLSSQVAVAFCIAPKNPYHHQYNTISHVVLPVFWILPILVDRGSDRLLGRGVTRADRSFYVAGVGWL